MDNIGFGPDTETARILSAIVDSSDDAIIVGDLNGTILAWNRGAELVYGYGADEVLGRSVDILAPAGREGEPDSILAHIRIGERIERYETVRTAKDGRLVDIALSVSPIRDAGGTVVGACAVGRDITASKKHLWMIETSEARLRSIVESAVDGIVVIDARGAIEAFNPAAERIFGYVAAETIGRNVSMLMPSPHAEEHDHYVSRYLATGVKRIIGIGREVTGRRKDGTTFPVQLSVGEMLIGDERKFTGILHDLTSRLQIEEQLREQAALVRLGEMAAVIAHEVRNPLAAIRGAIQVIGGRLPVGSREAAVTTDVIARIDTLNELVEDLLLFARPPHPRPSAVDVSVVLAATVELLREDTDYPDLRVDIVGQAPPVMADAELLKIVFLNLFLNSAHAMRGRGAINVSVTSTADACRIAVSDTGPGIPPEVRRKLFTPFFTTKARGTGLGLPTVKRLVEAHHGRILVACPPGGGTTMTVQLPLAGI